MPFNFRSAEDKAKSLVGEVQQTLGQIGQARAALDTVVVNKLINKLGSLRTSLNQVRSDISRYQPANESDKTARDNALSLTNQGLSLISKIQ